LANRVAPRNRLGAASRLGLVGWHDVDQRIPGAKLRQSTLALFEAQAETSR
jgi:hypothetical protein